MTAKTKAPEELRKADAATDATPKPKEPNLELLEQLSKCCTRWIVIPHFKSHEMPPKQHMYQDYQLVELYCNNRLTKATLIAGLQRDAKISKSNQQVVPASFFRTLDFLLDMTKAGKSYPGVSEKDLQRGGPRPGWCKLPVFTALKDEAASTPEGDLLPYRQALWEVLHSAKSFCFVYMYEGRADTIKCAMNVAPSVVWQQYERGEVTEFTPVLGLAELKPTKLWVPPNVMLPLGALVALQRTGRKYLPLWAADLKPCEQMGTQYLATRDTAKIETALAASHPGPAPAPAPSSSSSTASGGAARGPAGSTQQQQQQHQAAPAAASAAAAAPAAATAPLQPGAAAAAPAAPSSGAKYLTVDGILSAPKPHSIVRFDTPLFRLFQGDKGQHALCSNWWFTRNAADTKVQGPFSCEQMLLAAIGGLLDGDSCVCGTTNDVFPPDLPPMFCFQNLAELLVYVANGGEYDLISREAITELMGAMGGADIGPAPVPVPAPAPAPAPAPSPLSIAGSSAYQALPAYGSSSTGAIPAAGSPLLQPAHFSGVPHTQQAAGAANGVLDPAAAFAALQLGDAASGQSAGMSGGWGVYGAGSSLMSMPMPMPMSMPISLPEQSSQGVAMPVPMSIPMPRPLG